MAGQHDFFIDQGADFRAEITNWGVKDGETVEPYDLTDATASLLPWRYMLSIADDVIEIHLTGAQTSAMRFPASYVIEVTFASGEVRHALEGRMLGRHRSPGRY